MVIQFTAKTYCNWGMKCCLSTPVCVVYCGCHVRLTANDNRVLRSHSVSSFLHTDDRAAASDQP